MPLEIRHKLALVLRLMDTATGNLVVGRDLVLLQDGKPMNPLEKLGGNLVFLGEHADFDLTVQARGYEYRSVRVCYATLDKHVPQLDLHLVPGRDYYADYPCFALTGQFPGISAICAVKAGDSTCLIRGFDPRKKLVTLFNPHKLSLEREFYALVNPATATFEPFSILNRISDQQVKISCVLTTEFSEAFPICPIVFGMVEETGTYRLRVRDDSSDARWIVRWEYDGGTVAFQSVDFRKSETLALSLRKEQR